MISLRHYKNRNKAIPKEVDWEEQLRSRQKVKKKKIKK